MDDPEKNWKFGATDLAERKLWKHYMHVYAACLSATSTTDAPWYVVPDDKKNARLIISEIVLDAFKGLTMAYPKPTPERRRELQAIRSTLEK